MSLLGVKPRQAVLLCFLAVAFLASATLPALAPAPLTITTLKLPQGQVGEFYTATLTATGGSPPYSWFVWFGSLPPGLTLSSGGVIQGMPTAAGTFNFRVVVNDQVPANYDEKDLSITIKPAPFDFRVRVQGPSYRVADITELYTGEYAQIWPGSFTILVELLSGTPQTVSLSLETSLPGVEGELFPASGSPTFTSMLSVFINPEAADGLGPGVYGDLVIIKVRGTGGGLTRETDVRLFVKVSGDFWLLEAEPVQVVYDAPMVQGKMTIFMLRIESTFPKMLNAPVYFGFDNWATVSLGDEWQVWRDLETLSIEPGTNTYYLKPYGGSIYPLAPSASYTVTVDPDNVMDEVYEDNNRWPPSGSKSLEVVVTRGLKLLYAPLVFDWERSTWFGSQGSIDAYYQDVDRLAESGTDLMLGTYPIADSKLRYGVGGLYYFYVKGFWGQDVTSEGEYDDLWDTTKYMIFNDLYGDLQNLAWAAGYDLFVAIVPDGWLGSHYPDASADTTGMAWAGWGGVAQSVIVERDESANTVAHEIGHTTGYGEIYGGGVCQWRGSDGYWVSKGQPMSGGSTWFFMDYADCTPSWISLDGYNRFINALRRQSDPEVLGVRGMVFTNGTAFFASFLMLENQTADLEPGTRGNYTIVLLDDAGRVTGSIGFNLTFTVNIEPEGTKLLPLSPFAFRIPWVDGIRQIQLRDSEGRVLASRNVSPNPPTVKITFPNGGEELTGAPLTRYTVTWDASDPDGDQLSYTLLYSPDNGETWVPVETDIPEKRGTIDTGALQPGSRYILKVFASDGVNTGSDVSDAPFTVSSPAEFYVAQVATRGLAGVTARVSVDGSEAGRVGDDKPLLLRFRAGSNHTVALEQHVSGGEGVRFSAENSTYQVDSPGRRETVYAMEYLLTVRSDVGSPTGGGWYRRGGTAPFSIQQQVPMEGVLGALGGVYNFKGWGGDYQAATPTASIVMDGPKTVVAVMESDTTQAMTRIAVIAAVLVVVGLVPLLRRRRAKPP